MTYKWRLKHLASSRNHMSPPRKRFKNSRDNSFVLLIDPMSRIKARNWHLRHQRYRYRCRYRQQDKNMYGKCPSRTHEGFRGPAPMLSIISLCRRKEELAPGYRKLTVKLLSLSLFLFLHEPKKKLPEKQGLAQLG